MVDINEYTRETTCEYKGELYSVRDNGAVMRHLRKGKKARKLDNVWTFGTKNKANGYMMLNSHRVHIIVAKAFIPGNEDGNMVVDHIDTNRCNNRVENLRWLTRLENVLLNEATLKRVTFLCGGDIQKFIDNPSCLQDLTGGNQDIMWMRTVTPEEAKLAYEHISAWSKRPISTYKMMQNREKIKDFEHWLEVHKSDSDYHFNNEDNIFEQNQTKDIWGDGKEVNVPQYNDYFGTHLNIGNEQERLGDIISASLTDGALQTHFQEKMYFPLCPGVSDVANLDEYAKVLKEGMVVARSEGGIEYIISEIGWSPDWDFIQVEVEPKQNEFFIPYCIHISIEEDKYLHSQGEYQPVYRFCDSPNVLQYGATTQCYFPLCPKEGNISLEEYAALMQKDALFEKNKYSDGYIIDREITQSDNGIPIIYVGVRMPESYKEFGDVKIFVECGKVIHCIGRTYFDDRFLERRFCLLRGQEWNDKEIIIDDYC